MFIQISGNFFQSINAPTQFSNAGKIKLYLQNWKILTSDPKILEIVQGWRLPVQGRPQQVREPKQIVMSHKEQEAVNKEIKSMLDKGAVQEVRPEKEQFLSTIFVRPKKRGRQISPDNKLKNTEPTHALCAFQNGRHEECDRPTEQGGLHDQNRPKGCLLAYPHSPIIVEIPKVPVGKESLRDVSPRIWDRPLAPNIYQITKSTPHSVTPINDHNHSLPGRFFDNREEQGRSVTGERLCDISSNEFGFHHKLGKSVLEPTQVMDL